MLIPFDKLLPRHGVNPKGILHIGASTGQEAEVYSALNIRPVIWVEALPSIFLQLKNHIAKYRDHYALLACVSDVTGEVVKFNVASNDGQSSSMLEFGTHAKEHPTVRFVDQLTLTTTRMDELLWNSGYSHRITEGWMLNVDLQGAELKALRGLGEFIYRFDSVYIEVNRAELYKNCPLVEDIDAYLAGFGFVGVESKFTNHGWGDKLYVRSKQQNQS
jgi:FkbM family methyltransferase